MEALVDLIHVTFFGLRDDGDESPDTFSREAWPAFEVALMDGFYPCADDGEEQEELSDMPRKADGNKRLSC